MEMDLQYCVVKSLPDLHGYLSKIWQIWTPLTMFASADYPHIHLTSGQICVNCLRVVDFRWQTDCFSQILCDLLSPADENVKVGLRETTQNTSPHLRSKTLVADAQAQPQSPVQRQHQHQVRAASAHHHLDSQEVLALWITISQSFISASMCIMQPSSSSCPCSSVIIQKRWESLERPSLSRAHSLRMHGSSCGEEGLKRVCSAPQLGDQEKGSLLKRKLSVSDTEHCVVDRGSSKHKKQGQWPIPPLFSFLSNVLHFNFQIKSLLLLLSHNGIPLTCCALL